MGCYLSWVCPCLGVKKEPKVEEDVKLSTIDFIKQQNELDRLKSNDELGTSIAYFVMNKRRYYNI